MNEVLTIKQKKVLELIYNFLKDSGFPPTLADLKAELDVSSNQSVLNFLEILEKKQCIKREEGQARSIKILPLGLKNLEKDQLVPIAGTSAAGSYIESFVDIFTSWQPISNQILQNEKIDISRDKVFVIQISGDSMINAGINHGDMLLVKEAKEFISGDIVVARTSDGTTVKRFIADGGKRYLNRETPAYNNITIIPGEVAFDGKVILNLSKVK